MRQRIEHPRRRNYDPWLAEAKQSLLRCQADFFNRVEGRKSVNKTKDVDEALKQALAKTRANMTRDEKREIRKWAIDQHIAEVLQIGSHAIERHQMLNRHMLGLLSVRDDDGGDNMYVLQGFERFPLAIQSQESEIRNLEQGDSEQTEPARLVAERQELQASRQRSIDAASGTERPSSRIAPSTLDGGGRPTRRLRVE